MKVFYCLGWSMLLACISQVLQAQTLIYSTEIPTPVQCLSLSPDGKFFIVGTFAETNVFDTTGKIVKTLPIGTTVCHYSPDSKTYLTGSIMAGLFLWGSGSGPFLSAYMRDDERSDLSALALSSDGQLLVAGYRNSNLRAWSVFKHEPIELITPPKVDPASDTEDEDAAVGMADEEFLASPDDNSVADSKVIVPDNAPDQRVLSIAVSNDTKTVLFCKKGSPELFKIANGTQLTLIKDTLSSIQQVTFSPDQKMIITGHENGKICFWTLAGKLIRAVKGSNAAVLALGYARSGKKLFSVLTSGKVMVYNPQGQMIQELQLPTSSIKTVKTATLMPNGKLLIAGKENNRVELWRLPIN